MPKSKPSYLLKQPTGVAEVSTEKNLAMLQLFNSVFQTEITEPWWQWKYKVGGGRGFGYWEAGQLLSHCGIFPRHIHCAGESYLAWQLGDLMVTSSTRGRNLSRKLSPFAQVVKSVLECIPSIDNPKAIAFGFPSDRAMRIGERLGFFATIDQWFEIKLNNKLPNKMLLSIKPTVWTSPLVEKQINGLWDKMRADLKQNLVADRTANYWQWRYANHPSHTYHLIALKRPWWPNPLAFIVLRQTTPGHWLWVDFVGPTTLFALASLGAIIATQKLGGHSTVTFGSTMVAEALKKVGNTIQATEIRIMANPASGTQFMEQFMHKWWLTAGDTDYL